MNKEYQKPPMEKSDEAKPEELEMAREQGNTYVTALQHMAKEVADSGGEKKVGNYVVAYAVENAEGMYHLKAGELVWQDPKNENCHIEISVRDGADNRFIPGLAVSVTVVDSNENEIGCHKQEFLWHPWLYHYGRNWQVPADGKYKLVVNIEAPKFMRHDKKNGLRFAEDIEVRFEDVKIKTGKK